MNRYYILKIELINKAYRLRHGKSNKVLSFPSLKNNTNMYHNKTLIKKDISQHNENLLKKKPLQK